MVTENYREHQTGANKLGTSLLPGDLPEAISGFFLPVTRFDGLDVVGATTFGASLLKESDVPSPSHIDDSSDFSPVTCWEEWAQSSMKLQTSPFEQAMQSAKAFTTQAGLGAAGVLQHS